MEGVAPNLLPVVQPFDSRSVLSDKFSMASTETFPRESKGFASGLFPSKTDLNDLSSETGASNGAFVGAALPAAPNNSEKSSSSSKPDCSSSIQSDNFVRIIYPSRPRRRHYHILSVLILPYLKRDPHEIFLLPLPPVLLDSNCLRTRLGYYIH
jgi:hypothetical protein